MTKRKTINQIRKIINNNFLDYDGIEEMGGKEWLRKKGLPSDTIVVLLEKEAAEEIYELLFNSDEVSDG